MPACPFHGEGEKQDSFLTRYPQISCGSKFIRQAGSGQIQLHIRDLFTHQSQLEGRKKKYINEQPNSPHTSLSLHLFLASSYFAWLVTPPSPEHPANKKQKSWSFVGIKEGTGSALNYKQVQTPSLGKIKVVSHVIPPTASSAFKVLGEGRKKIRMCQEKMAHLHQAL